MNRHLTTLVVAGLGAAGLAILAVVGQACGDDASPSATPGAPTVAATPTAAPELSPSPTASTSATTPPRTAALSIAPGQVENLALPVFDRATAITVATSAELRRDWAGALTVASADTSTYQFRGAVGEKAPGGQFLLEARYQGPGLHALSIMSWTPTGQVGISIPMGPTHAAQELVVAGHQIVIIMPTANVVERRGLYRAYMAGGRVVHLVEAVDFSDADDFVGLVTRMTTEGEVR